MRFQQITHFKPYSEIKSNAFSTDRSILAFKFFFWARTTKDDGFFYKGRPRTTTFNFYRTSEDEDFRDEI